MKGAYLSDLDVCCLTSFHDVLLHGKFAVKVETKVASTVRKRDKRVSETEVRGKGEFLR